MATPTNKRHKKIVLTQLQQLKGATAIKGPKVVFCHLICPHEPFVFSANDSQSPYIQQVAWISKELNRVVDHILQNNQTEPIILLQADHGTVHDCTFLGRKSNYYPLPAVFIKNALSPLNTWYIPEKDKAIKEKLYRSISLVNTFRLIFDYYFNTKLGLLDDHSYMFLQPPTVEKLMFVNVDHILNKPPRGFVDTQQLFSIDFLSP